jgi:hypothetical protein
LTLITSIHKPDAAFDASQTKEKAFSAGYTAPAENAFVLCP